MQSEHTHKEAGSNQAAPDGAAVSALIDSIAEVVVGQREMVEGLMVGLLTGGHVLLEGLPGLAKTLTVSSLAKGLDATFSRVQFTPDLLPADVVGTLIYQPRDGEFTVRKGPVFANLVLADEINRAPAKVQSALLEAMQERSVTIGDETHRLPSPFLVLATQNPIEQEGTYPLPEAQVDRFMLKLRVGYPSRDDERTIIDRMAGSSEPEIGSRVGLAQLKAARARVAAMPLDPRIRDYIVDLVFATREPQSLPSSGAGDHGLERLIEIGASPRASIALAKASRARAFLDGRDYVTPSDVKRAATDVLRHRLVMSYEAEAEGVTSDDAVASVLGRVPVP